MMHVTLMMHVHGVMHVQIGGGCKATKTWARTQICTHTRARAHTHLGATLYDAVRNPDVAITLQGDGDGAAAAREQCMCE